MSKQQRPIRTIEESKAAHPSNRERFCSYHRSAEDVDYEEYQSMFYNEAIPNYEEESD